jgi:chromosome segregation ATPase
MGALLHLDEKSVRLEAVLRRLAAALDQLDAASERQAKVELARADLVQELALMQEDRQRLAVELDAALARCETLEKAQAEIVGRLQNASFMVEAILAEIPDVP